MNEEPLPITDDVLAKSERQDFEKGMSYLPVFTLAVIALVIAIYIWEMASGALNDEASILSAGALARDRVLAGEAWRMLSAIFLHGSLDHLVGNCLILYVLGIASEHAMGIKRTMLVYFLSGLAGSLLSITMHQGPGVGASGAIFGLMAGVIAFLYRYQQKFRVRDKRIGLVLLIWALYAIISGALVPLVDNAAHVGGALMGGLLVFKLFR